MNTESNLRIWVTQNLKYLIQREWPGRVAEGIRGSSRQWERLGDWRLKPASRLLVTAITWDGE